MGQSKSTDTTGETAANESTEQPKKQKVPTQKDEPTVMSRSGESFFCPDVDPSWKLCKEGEFPEWPRYHRRIKPRQASGVMESIANFLIALWCHSFTDGTEWSVLWSWFGFTTVLAMTITIYQSDGFRDAFNVEWSYDHWEKPWSYFGDAVSYLYSYVLILLIALVLAPCWCGNEVRKPRIYLYVALFIHLLFVGILVAIGNSDWDIYTNYRGTGTGEYKGLIWLIALILVGLDMVEIVRVIFGWHKGPHPLLKQRWHEAYVRELLSPRANYEQLTVDGQPTIPDYHDVYETIDPIHPDTKFIMPDGSTEVGPQRYIDACRKDGMAWEEIMNDVVAISEGQKLAHRATERYEFRWMGDNRDFMTCCCDALWPQPRKVQNPHRWLKNWLPYPSLVMSAFFFSWLLLLVVAIQAFVFAEDTSNDYAEKAAERRVKQAEQLRSYTTFNCATGPATCVGFVAVPINGSITTLPCEFYTTLCGSIWHSIEEYDDSASFYEDLSGITYNSQVFGGTMGLVTVGILPFAMFQGFKKKLLELREQKCLGYYLTHHDRDIYTVYHTSFYVGAYASFILLGFFLTDLVFVILWWLLAYQPIRDPLLNFGIGWCISYAILYAFNTMIIRDFLFNKYVTNTEHLQMLERPNLYKFLLVVLVIFQLPLQAGAALYRVVYLVCFDICSLYRVDLSMMPRGMETFDSGFLSFAAVLLLAERQNSPLVMVAIDCMCLTTELNATIPQEVVSKRQAREELTEGEALQLRRMHVAHNRWRLALTLIRNPSLKKFRKRRLYREAKDVELSEVGVSETVPDEGRLHVEDKALEGPIQESTGGERAHYL